MAESGSCSDHTTGFTNTLQDDDITTDNLISCDRANSVQQFNWELTNVKIDDRGDNPVSSCVTDGCKRDLSYHFTMSIYEYTRGGIYQIELYDQNDRANNYQINPVSAARVHLHDLGVYGHTIGDADGHNYCGSYGNKEYDWSCDFYSDSDVANTPFAYRILEKQYATSYAGEAISFTVSASDFTHPDSRFGFSYLVLAGSCDDDLDCTWDEVDQSNGYYDYYNLQ